MKRYGIRYDGAKVSWLMTDGAKTNKPFAGTQDAAIRLKKESEVMSAELVELEAESLTVDSLARALFRTDERVIADVAQGTEYLPETVRQVVQGLDLGAPESTASINRGFDKAFSTNRNNWAADSKARAAAMLSLLQPAGAK